MTSSGRSSRWCKRELISHLCVVANGIGTRSTMILADRVQLQQVIINLV